MKKITSQMCTEKMPFVYSFKKKVFLEPTTCQPILGYWGHKDKHLGGLLVVSVHGQPSASLSVGLPVQMTMASDVFLN